MPLFLSALAGFIVGGALLYFFQGQKIARLVERLSSQERELSSERATKEKLQNEFKLIAFEVARQVRADADQSLDHKKQEFAFLATDMKAKFDDTQQIVRKFEEERATMYGKLEQTLAQVLSAEQSLRLETGALKRVLTSSSGIRGRWGEKVLQEILEQNDFVRGIDFETQVFISGDNIGEASRPDFVVRLPGNKKLIIDSKEVAGEYVLAQETQDPEKQKEHYEQLVQNIRNNFIKLSRKEYQSQLDPDIPFVIMFIPSEAAIRAAFATDPNIFQEATERHVILASPMTIIPLVYLIKHGWQQEQLATNARELGVAVEELGSRLYAFVEHLQNIGNGIKKASESWNKAVGSWQSRVSPQIERAKSLGGRLKETSELSAVEHIPRAIGEKNSVEETV